MVNDIASLNSEYSVLNKEIDRLKNEIASTKASELDLTLFSISLTSLVAISILFFKFNSSSLRDNKLAFICSLFRKFDTY